MFKRLLAKLRRKSPVIVDPLIDVYGIKTTGEPVLLRQVRLSSIPPVDGPLAPPNPKRLSPVGIDQSPEAVKQRARAWLVSTLPDAAVFR